MKISIPVKYKKSFLESNFTMPDGTVCEMDKLSYLYSDSGEVFLCLTEIGSYNDGQCTMPTKTINVYNCALNEISCDQDFFVHVEVGHKQ